MTKANSRNVATKQETSQRFLLRAQPEVAGIEKVGDRVIKGTFFTSRPVLRYDWWEDKAFELQFSSDPKDWNLERVNSGVCTFLDNHYGDRIGLITKVEINGEGGTFEATLSRKPTGDVALNDFEDGIFGGISFGSVVGELEEVKPAEYTGIGRNRKLVTLPLMMAKDIELMEISRADIPANPEAIARLHNEMKELKVSMANVTRPIDQGEGNDDDEDVVGLKEQITKLRQEKELLATQLADQTKKTELSDRYNLARQKAEKLLNAAKISAAEFSNVFATEVTKDVEKLAALAEVARDQKLAGIEFWLEQCELRSPLLPLERHSSTESVATEAPPGSTGDNAIGKEYMSTYEPKRLY